MVTNTALRLLQRLGNCAAGASAGILLMDPTGSTLPVKVVCAILAAALTVDTGAAIVEGALDEGKRRLERVETWLEELIRKHGRVDRAIEAISEGRASDPDIDVAQASWLASVFKSSSEALGHLADSNARIESLVLYIGQQHHSLLEGVSDDVAVIKLDVASTKSDVADIKSWLQARGGEQLSDEHIHAMTADAAENAEFRRAKLREFIDGFEHVHARALSVKSWNWVRRQPAFAPAQRARLIETVLDEHISYAARTSDHERTRALSDVRALCDFLKTAMELVDEPDRLRMSSLIAVAAARYDRPSVGLQQLEGRDDAYAIRRRIAILCDEGEYEDAVALIRDRPRDIVWAERAMIAYVANGDYEGGKETLNWILAAGQQHHQDLRALCFFGQAVIEQVGGKMAPATELSAVDRPVVTDTLRTLDPSAQELVRQKRALSNLETELLRLRLNLRLLINDGHGAEAEALRLADCSPFHLILVELARKGWVTSDPNWPQRIRTELPRSCENELCAISLDAMHDDRHSIALHSALRLVPEAATEEERFHLHALLAQLAQDVEKSSLPQIEEALKSLSDPKSRPAQYWAISRMIQEGKAEEAVAALAPLTDERDPVWLQLHGQALLRLGKSAEAVGEISKGALAAGSVALLHNAAGLALSYKCWTDAAALLERVVELIDPDVPTRANLATVWHLLGRNAEAAEAFADLSRQHPEQTVFSINAAECFVLAGRPDTAVTLLERVCEVEAPAIGPLLRLSQLYVERGDARKGFALLSQARSNHWSDYQFVAVYWSVAIAAEEEDLAHEAIGQMLALQQAKLAPPDLLVPKTFDELKEWMKMQEDAERRRTDVLLAGQCPTGAIDAVRSTPAMEAWTRRTWRRDWIFEGRSSVADATIYASNGFAVVRGGDHDGELVSIAAPAVAGPVAADLSALLTLHRLGILPLAATYCGTIHVPERYLFKMFSDHARLRPHQPSSQTLLTDLAAMHGASRLRVLHDGATAGVPVVDEHYPEPSRPEGTYHLADLVNALQAGKAISEAELTRLRLGFRRPATAGEGQPPLTVGMPIQIGLTTLGSLHCAGLLERVIDKFIVYLSQDDYGLICKQSAGFAALEDIRREHLALWDFLRDNPAIVKHGQTPDGEKWEAVDAAYLSMALAQKTGYPLLADDRCLQSVILNERGAATAAFGTVQLLEAMTNAGLLETSKSAEHTVQLMEWRYRFIVPTSELLAVLARRSLGLPPGQELHTVAKYVHGCLRDPGLFAGLESCQPQTTMAMRYRQAVELELGEFVAELWLDLDVSDEKATELTEWTLQALLPSPPVNMEPGIRVLATSWHPIFLTSFLLRLASGGQDCGRGNKAIRTLAGLVGLSYRQVVRRAVEVIDAFAEEQ